MPTFTVRVARVGEGEHQEPEFTVEDATEISVGDDGRLIIRAEGGRVQDLSATSWGAFRVVRVQSASGRV